MKTVEAVHVKDLLEKYKKNQTHSPKGEKLNFSGVGDRDVYNITAPFLSGDEVLLAGRVERRDSEISEVVIFKQEGNNWVPRENTKTFRLQDPFYTVINGELVFGGVKVITDHDNDEKIVSWVTEFYRGKDIDSLELFATGPAKMKDIRLAELPSGEVLVFTRPQGGIGGMGKIGFIKISSLDQLNVENIEKAYIFLDQFVPQEWGGSNETHLLSNGMIGVLGHIACLDEERKKHYYSIVFAFDPRTNEKTPLKLIACRSDFPDGPAKRPDLVDILFSGGLIRLDGGKAELYTGVSDTEAHVITIDDPFLEYEQL